MPSPRFVCSLFLAGAALAVWPFAFGEDAKPETADKDFSAELPRIAPKSPEDELKSFKTKPGFHLELVASEPLIRSPMAMDFDEYGRAFVVELPEYNQYASAKPHGQGDVKLLEDTDGDGRYDKATVYVDGLSYPTGVACWDGGILVGVAPDLLYCKDTDGEGKADIRKKLFTGFGQDKAGEGMLNSFRWRIDNRFHIPCGLDGGDIVAATDAAAPVEAKRKPVSVRGQHLLLDPRGMTIQATSGGGQHGMSLDDWNFFPFVCGNSEPCHLVMYDGRYLARNPYQQAPAAAINIAPEGKFTKLMRISAVEPWRILRTRLRSKGIIPGSDEGGAPSGFFTAATGITAYRGDAWPAEYRGQLFIGEAANNLIYRAKLEPNGVGLTAKRADSDAEFLASSDNWFRPVQFANAPDGTLYVLDMYRELIEGAAFLAPQILKHMDPSAGADKGRIYRIAPDGFAFKAPPRLGDLSSAELVKLLEHPNAWHRETASRLIYQRQDAAAVAPLKEVAAKSASPLARTMALYSLDGLRALEASLVIAALKAGEPEVRQHALRLGERFADNVEVRAAVLPLAEDPQIRVRYQAAFSLGAFEGPEVVRALARMGIREEESWFKLAVFSSIGRRRGAFLSAVLNETGPNMETFGPAIWLVKDLAGQIGAAGDAAEVAVLLSEVEKLSKGETARLAPLLIQEAVARQSGKGLLSEAAGGKAKEILAGLVREAQATAKDEKSPPEKRAAAVRTLASGSLSEMEELFAELLQSKQPQPVQAAALETLARFDAPAVPPLVLAAWPSLTPQLRASAVETLLSRPAWVLAFFDAIEAKKIGAADLDPARVALLKQSADATVRQRAGKLFAGVGLSRRKEVFDAYQKSLALKGDVCAACHKLEGHGESIGADLNAIRDRGTDAVLLNILDPNREVKPQFITYVVTLNSGRVATGMIAAETANSLTLRKADNTSEAILRVNIEDLKSTGLSFMPEGIEKQLDVEAMADLLAYLNSIK